MSKDKHITSLKEGSSARWFKTDVNYLQPDLRVDAENGIIKDVAVCTAGEAKGHGVMLEQSFIEEVVKQGNAHSQGLKSRFGHPTMSNESLGNYMGRFKNFRVVGIKAIADLHLDDVCKKAPGGDLYSWTIAMAQKNPDHFGTSIQFIEKNVYHYDEKGQTVIGYNPGEGPTFSALKELLATDIVDDPAANADGLFSSANFNAEKFAVRVTEFLDENPAIWDFVEKHPDKFQPFLDKYSEYKTKKSPTIMSKKNRPGKGFFAKLASAFTEAYDTTDHVTDDGTNIRIVAVEEQPAIDDEVFVVAEDGSVSIAPDGSYTIVGGELDGYVISVLDGKISAIVIPEIDASSKQTVAALQAEKKAADKLKAENDKLKKELKAKQDELEAFKKKPLAEHTAVGGDEDSTTITGDTDTDTQFREQPWNKKYKKYNRTTITK